MSSKEQSFAKTLGDLEMGWTNTPGLSLRLVLEHYILLVNGPSGMLETFNGEKSAKYTARKTIDDMAITLMRKLEQ